MALSKKPKARLIKATAITHCLIFIIQLVTSLLFQLGKKEKKKKDTMAITNRRLSTEEPLRTRNSQTSPSERIPYIRNKFIDLEWQQRNRLVQGQKTSGPASQWARLSGDEVTKRNRYTNIDPYSSNRVHLRVPEGHNDYINASPISLKSSRGGKSINFIATQGPKESSTAHFWRMIWHETAHTAVIIMLTQTHESGREKCFQYFPLDTARPVLRTDASDEFRDSFTATVTLVGATYDPVARCTLRELRLQVGGLQKTVWHLLFIGWPDFLIPEGKDRVALLELVRLSRRLNGGAGAGSSVDGEETQPNPRIVHCSAGVGRSGTFIALDYLLGELEQGGLDGVPPGEDRIMETVDLLRQQRMMMVQGEGQFAFLYDVLKEQWLEKHKGTISAAGNG